MKSCVEVKHLCIERSELESKLSSFWVGCVCGELLLTSLALDFRGQNPCNASQVENETLVYNSGKAVHYPISIASAKLLADHI